MPSFSQVIGLKEAVAAFKRLPDIARENLNVATEETAQRIAAGARARVRRRYGFLQQQISHKITKATGVAVVGIVKGSFNLPGGGSATPTKYGHLVEFGHGGPHPARAYPFMIPAAEVEKTPYLNRCRNAGKGIERDMAGAGGLL